MKLVLFACGPCDFTTRALALPMRDVELALARHLAGQWGDIGADLEEANRKAVASGGDICSVHASSDGTWFSLTTTTTDPRRTVVRVVGETD